MKYEQVHLQKDMSFQNMGPSLTLNTDLLGMDNIACFPSECRE